MAALLKYFFLRRWNNLWTKASILFTLIKGLGVLLILCIGFVFSKIGYQSLDQRSGLPNGVRLICVSFLFYPVFMNLFKYKPKTDLIPKIFPITPQEKTVIEIWYDLIGFEYFIAAVFSLTLFLFAPFFTAYDLAADWIAIVYIAVLINIVKVLIERRPAMAPVRKAAVAICVAALTGLIYLGVKYFLAFPYFLISAGAALSASFFMLAFIEQYSEPRMISLSNVGVFQKIGPMTRLIVERKEIFKAVGYVVVIRVGLLFYLSSTLKGDSVDASFIQKYLFYIAPLGSIGFIFNTFGFLRDPWLLIQNNHLEENIHRAYHPTYQKMVFYPLLIILVCTLGWMVWLRFYQIEYYLFFIWTFVMTYCAGYFSSVNRTVYYKAQEKGSLFIILVGMSQLTAFYLFLLPFWNAWFYGLYLIFIIGFYYYYEKTKVWAVKNKYLNFERLFN